MEISKPQRVWTVAEAKARLSEVLRLAEEEGPQAYRQEKHFHRSAQTTVAKAIATAQAVGPVAGREHAARDRTRYPGPQFKSEDPVCRRGRRMRGYLLDTNVVSEATSQGVWSQCRISRGKNVDISALDQALVRRDKGQIECLCSGRR